MVLFNFHTFIMGLMKLLHARCAMLMLEDAAPIPNTYYGQFWYSLKSYNEEKEPKLYLEVKIESEYICCTVPVHCAFLSLSVPY